MTKKRAKKAVFAAGCVVWRRAGANIEVLLIHRPRYDDWSLPKGKREAGEDDLACALREVEEETSVVGVLGAELETVYYKDHKGRDKTVRYWALEDTTLDRPLFEPNDEVDEIEWASPATSVDTLTYSHDQALVTQLLDLLA